MTKREPSRPQRWAQAIERAREALDHLTNAKDDVETSVRDLAYIQAEYQEWRDNLPANLEGGVLAEKLDAVCQLELNDQEIDISQVESVIEEAEGVELPRGFGRD